MSVWSWLSGHVLVEQQHPQTAYRWLRKDRMLVPARRLDWGTIWVDAASVDETGRTVVYARVSSHERRADLDRWVARLTDWTTANGHQVGEVVCEIGSGLNAEAAEIAADLCRTRVRVWWWSIATVWPGSGSSTSKPRAVYARKVVVADPGETADDLVRDMIEVLTSRCARLYGRWGARNLAMRAVTATKQDDEVSVGG